MVLIFNFSVNSIDQCASMVSGNVFSFFLDRFLLTGDTYGMNLRILIFVFDAVVSFEFKWKVCVVLMKSHLNEREKKRARKRGE